MQKPIAPAPAPNQNFVNETVSWQSKATVLVMRSFIKKSLGKAQDITKLRKFVAKIDNNSKKITSELETKEIHVDGIPCRWIAAPSKSHRVILYLHGGGFCINLPKIYQYFVTQLCQQLDANALIPDYRLAPEHPFPAGITDCLNAYRWLLSQGYAAKNIIIAGDSAGGCLTLTTLLQIRDKKLDAPAAAVLLSPVTDIRHPDQQSVSVETANNDPMLTLAALKDMAEMYNPDGVSDESPLLSPLFGDFSDLPPLQFHVGSTEILFSHSVGVLQKAQEQGVETSLHVWKNMPHVHALLPWLPESTQTIKLMTEFMAKHLK